MINNISIHAYKKAKIGWHYAKRVLEHLNKTDSKIHFLYLNETKELVILDDSLIEILDFLQISYKISLPSQTIQYIKEDT